MSEQSAIVQKLIHGPALVPLPLAADVCGFSRPHGYELHRTGQFPVPVMEIGKRLKCRRVDLMRFLGLEQSGGTAA